MGEHSTDGARSGAVSRSARLISAGGGRQTGQPSLCQDKVMSEVLAFSAEQVCRLTGLSNRQLRYWDNTDFFSPAFREEARRSPFARVYSFRDVVGLRAITEMRKVHDIPLQRLRKVGAELRTRFDQPWSALTFYIVGKLVFYQEQRDVAIKRADRSGQSVMPFHIVRVEGDVTRAIALLRRRWSEHVG